MCTPKSNSSPVGFNLVFRLLDLITNNFSLLKYVKIYLLTSTWRKLAMELAAWKLATGTEVSRQLLRISGSTRHGDRIADSEDSVSGPS